MLCKQTSFWVYPYKNASFKIIIMLNAPTVKLFRFPCGKWHLL